MIEPTATRRLFWLLMAVTAGARLYYLFMTSHQPVWWDEAEYLVKAKALALGTPDSGFWEGRPPLLPMLLSGVFAIGLGEITIRLLLAVASQAAVYLTYLIGVRLFGELAGIIAAWLFGLFYVNLFYTVRVMTEIPHLVLVLLAFQQLVSGVRFGAAKAALALSLAVWIRYPSALIFVVMGAYILRTQGLSAFRNRQNGMAAGVALCVALPFLLSSELTSGDPFSILRSSSYLMPDMDITARFSGLEWYWHWAIETLGLATTAVVVTAVIVSLVSVLIGKRFNRSSDTSLADFLLLLWLAVPVAYFGLFVRPTIDRYLLLALPPVFLLTGRLLAWVVESQGYRGAVTARISAIVMLVSGASFLETTNTTIRDRKASFAELRDAAAWIRPHLTGSSVVLSKSIAQLTYYTSHVITDLPDSLADFQAMRKAGPADFIVITSFEAHPAWIASLPREPDGFREVAVFPDIGAPSVYVLKRDRSR